ncbi:conserved hypothetical protein [Levilactobacillus brevis KB290]|uniref:Uncharacterized protein n=1 Tax=Levilactobacillus brevis KB290 TaxID=1001583 RepID=M5AER3_LEVBR|nr:hypothetical protein [Levilactobacillus brevis]BAN07333.1 conserved hypothetical protein [Levilactobacillus brevis KB290]
MASNDEQRSATTILTTAAQSIAARLIANETTAKFTKAEISTTNLFNQSVTELQVLTSLDNVQQTADINTVTVINNNTVNVNVAIDQTKAPNNYQMNSVGLFAVDGDGKEVLYSVTVLKDPVYVHQDAMGSALGIDLETVVGQASNVEISVNPAGAVTNEILKATLADYVKTDDSTVVHTADMRKPASDVAGIDEVNAKQDKLTITPADDSKVAHLSGANNFDTVPTVNTHPLLLASSLPSDLARTSQQANFTGKLQKSGVDVATVDDVSAKQDKLDYTPANDANTFHRSPDTGAVTESGNFPGLQVKGVDVATAADLKSVEESAWREITNPAFQGSYLFRDNEDGTASLAGTIYFYNRSQQYNENDDYIVPMPDGYKATGVASEGSLMGFINDFSVSLQGLKAYFPGTALHLYTDLNQNRPLSIPLCSIISSSATGITSSPIVLKVVKIS